MWFRVDDRFDTHPKVRNTPRAALGLWVVCATYSSRHELDGFVPDDVAKKYSEWRNYARDGLVKSGLWLPSPGGFVMHDFADYNATAEKRAELRAKWKAAKDQQRAGSNGAVDEGDDDE